MEFSQFPKMSNKFPVFLRIDSDSFLKILSSFRPEFVYLVMQSGWLIKEKVVGFLKLIEKNESGWP